MLRPERQARKEVLAILDASSGATGQPSLGLKYGNQPSYAIVSNLHHPTMQVVPREAVSVKAVPVGRPVTVVVTEDGASPAGSHDQSAHEHHQETKSFLRYCAV